MWSIATRPCRAGAVSQAYTDASRNQLTVLAGSRDAIQAELDTARGSSEAARGKVYMSSTDGALGSLAQRQEELRAENVQLEAEIKQREEYGQLGRQARRRRAGARGAALQP